MAKNIMMIAVSVIFCLSMSADVEARGGGSHSKRGYIKRDGTYVAPSRATNPNSTKIDNWSTKGNFNPYSGKAGSKSPF